MAVVYLALGGAVANLSSGFMRAPAPAVLCSYAFYSAYDRFLTGAGGVQVREWVLDSGAYSVKKSGTEIKLSDYIDFCKRIADSAVPPREVYALDVIGDWRASQKNVEAMWAAGVPAIPCYHAGEPEDYLRGLAADYPKIALGGASGVLYGDARLRYFAQAFARVWPKRVHGFGVTVDSIVMGYPFDSVDSTSWQIGPTRYGSWKTYGVLKGIRSGHYLRPEVDHYLDMEARSEARWARDLAKVRAA